MVMCTSLTLFLRQGSRGEAGGIGNRVANKESPDVREHKVNVGHDGFHSESFVK